MALRDGISMSRLPKRRGVGVEGDEAAAIKEKNDAKSAPGALSEQLRPMRERRAYSRRQDPVVQNSQPPRSLNVSRHFESELSDGCGESSQEIGDGSICHSRVAGAC